MNNREVRKHKELSILREGVHSNWRDELQEEHPYVDVMPSTGDKQKEIEKKMKELKKAKKAEGEVKEETLNEMDYQQPPSPPAEVRPAAKASSKNPGVMLPFTAGTTAALMVGAGIEKDAKNRFKKKQDKKKAPKIKPTFEETEEFQEDYEGYNYVGKEGKNHKVSNGISTKHLNNKEFGEFSRQKMGRSKKKEVKEGKSLGMNDPQREIDSMEAKQKSGGNLGAMGRARLNLYKSKFGKKK